MTFQPVESMHMRLDERDRPEWDRTTPQEDFLWVACIVAHQKQALIHEDPCIGFYGVVRNKKEFTALSDNIKKWFREEHGIPDVPIYQLQMSWQRPHLLTLDKKHMVDSAYVTTEINEIIARAYKLSEVSKLEMSIRQRADVQKNPEIADSLRRKMFRKLIKPKMPAWKANFLKGVEEEKEAIRKKAEQERAEAAAELAAVERRNAKARALRTSMDRQNVDEPVDEDEEKEDGEGSQSTSKQEKEEEEDLHVDEKKTTEEVVTATVTDGKSAGIKTYADKTSSDYKVPLDVKKSWGFGAQSKMAISSLISNKGEVLFYLNAVYDDNEEKMAHHIQNHLIPRIDGPISIHPLPMFRMINMAAVHSAVKVEDIYADKALNEAFHAKATLKNPTSPNTV